MYTYKHHFIGDIDYFNRTLANGIVNLLYGKPLLNFTYWVYAYNYFIVQPNFNDIIHDYPYGMSPYAQWTGEKPDLRNYYLFGL